MQTSQYIYDRLLRRQDYREVRVAADALDLYRLILWRAGLRRWWSVLIRQPHSQLTLRQLGPMGTVHGTCAVGICAVPIRQIRGSENRSDDFDADFRPRQQRTAGRWMSIATAYLMGVRLPPVELLQVHDVYYVRDGHHRISVARAMGQEYIEAEVLVLELGAQPLCATPAAVTIPKARGLGWFGQKGMKDHVRT